MARDRNLAREAKASEQQGRQRHRRAAAVRGVRWGAVVVGAVAALAFALGRVPADDVDVRGTAALGQPAPAIAITDFDGQRFDLADYRGKPLVVNFWASWCPNCAAEMPDFEKVHQKVAGRVEFLGVNQSDSRGPAQDLAHDTGVTYRLAEDPRGEVFRAFGAPGMPTTVFIDADGTVRDVVVGQLSADTLLDYIARTFGREHV